MQGVGAVFEEPASAATPSPSRCLHVASVAPSCTEEYLYLVFSPFGDVEALKCVIEGVCVCVMGIVLQGCGSIRVLCLFSWFPCTSFTRVSSKAQGACGGKWRWAHMNARVCLCVHEPRRRSDRHGWS